MFHLLSRSPRRQHWRAGLIHIFCTCCNVDLDWAQPQFVARNPYPRCTRCLDERCPVPQVEVAYEPSVVRAEADVHVIRSKQLPAGSPFNADFEVAVEAAEVVER